MNFPKLPLLDDLASFWNKADFSNTVLVGIQHLLASNAALMVKLAEAGLDYERMFLLGKVYSSNLQVAEALKGLGIFVHQSSFELNSVNLLENYHLQLNKAAVDLIEIANRKLQSQPRPRKLLIIDDGGTLIGLVNQYRESIDAEIVAVEQTRNGVRVAIGDRLNLLFPVINVAESKAKLYYESPYIASSIIKRLETKIQNRPARTELAELETLVVGIGAVGMEVAKQLKAKVGNLAVYDLDDERRTAASKNGLLAAGLEDGLGQSQMVVGCVGRNWLPIDSEQLIQDGAILASGSSSNVEFLGLNVLNGHDEDGSKLAHRDYLVKVQNGRACILNAGFPINFDGSPDPIPPKVIQFTRGLMLAGIYQAIEAKPSEKRLIKLDERLQDFLVRAAKDFSIV